MAHDQVAQESDKQKRQGDGMIQWNALVDGYDYGYQYNLFYNLCEQNMLAEGKISMFVGTKVIGPAGVDENSFRLQCAPGSVNGFFYRCDITGYKKKEKKV